VPLSPQQVASLVDGLIPIAGGVMCSLYGFRVLGKAPGADARFDAWYQRYGKLLRVLGPVVVVFGLWRLSPAFLSSPGEASSRLRNSPLGLVQVGTVWIYQSPGGDVTISVVAHERMNQVLCARRQATQGGKVVQTDFVCPQNGAVWKFGANGGVYVPALPIVYESPGGSRRWEYRSASGKLSLDFEQSDGGPIQTPLGRYERTTLVTFRGSDTAGEQVTQSWYVEGIGLVREHTKSPGGEVVLELRSFFPASEP
jgi:hypothetical protein